MKLLSLLTVACVSLLPVTRAEVPLPPDVQKIVDQRDAAVAKVSKSYLQELEKLKTIYTKRGNLEVANKIVGLMQQQAVYSDLVARPFKGKWIYKLDDPSDRRRMAREFDDTHMIDENGGRHPFSVKGNSIQINWGGSRNFFEQLTIDPEEPNVMHGVNQNGTRFTYTRREK